MCGSQLAVCLVSLFVSVCRSCVSSSSVQRPPIPRWCPVRAWLFFTFLPTYLPRYIVGKSRHRAHTESQREESGESQFLGSLWRATLSREAWMPIWGLSTESIYEALAASLPVVAEVMEPSDGDGAGVRVFQGVTTRTDPSRTERLCPGKAQ